MSPSSAPDLRPLSAGLLAGVLAVAFEGIAVTTAMPAAATQLGRLDLYAWAFSLFMAGMLAGNVAAGRMADRRGPTVPLLVGMAVFAVGLLIGGLAPSMEVLLASRLVQGLGGGAINVGLYVVVAHVYPEESRPLMMTGFSACWVLPAFVGPPVAAWLTRTWSWHWVFLGVVPLVVAASLAALGPLLAIHRGERPGRAENSIPAWVGVVLAGAAMALQYAGQRVSAVQDAWVLVALLAGLALLALGLPALMPRGFLTFEAGLPAVMASRALVSGAFFGAEAFVPLMLVQTRGLSLGWAGAMLTVGSVGWFLGSWLQAQRWLRLARHQLIVLGSLCVGLGIASCAVVAYWPTVWMGLAWCVWPLAGLGMGLVIASTGLAQMALSAPSEQGRNAAALQSGESLGNSMITGLAGAVFAWLHAGVAGAASPRTFGLVLVTMVAVAGLGLAASARVGRIGVPGEG